MLDVKPIALDELRAAKLSHVPGVTIAEACERFGVTKAAVSRARKLPESKPSLAELALAALTSNGTRTTGSINELENVAGWIDYLDHSGATVAEVRTLLSSFVSFEGSHWRFDGSWP